MATILLVNDDGPDSPTLPPFIAALDNAEFCDELRVVLPAEEQSWIAQSITRFRTLSVYEQPIGPTRAFLVNGTPADCANLGVNNLFEGRPDAVVSGINIGSNAGLAFFLSSGTVGGAAEGFLFGLKAVALSITATPEVFRYWTLRKFDELRSMSADFARLGEVAANVVGRLLSAPIWDTTQLVSVNIPWSAHLETKGVVTRLADTRFEAFFKETAPNQFRHDFKALIFPPRSTENAHLISDIEALESGLISINPVSYRLSDSLAAEPLRQIFS